MADNRSLVPFPAQGLFAYVGSWSYGSFYAGTANRSSSIQASGVLLGDQYVLTAGHVAGDLADLSYFTLPIAPTNSGQTLPNNIATYSPAGPNYVNFSYPVKPADPKLPDIAAVRLNGNTTVPDSSIPGMVVFEDPTILANKNVTIAGYPEDKNFDLYQETGLIATATSNGVVNFSDDVIVAPGQSGGPIFYKYGNKTYIAGVVTGFFGGGSSGPGTGTVFTNSIYNNVMSVLQTTEQMINHNQLPSNLIIGSNPEKY